jgi:hypothetical protein
MNGESKERSKMTNKQLATWISAVATAFLTAAGGGYLTRSALEPSINKDIEVVEQRGKMSREAEVVTSKLRVDVDMLKTRQERIDQDNARIAEAIVKATMTGEKLASEIRSYTDSQKEIMGIMRDEIKRLDMNIQTLTTKVDDHIMLTTRRTNRIKDDEK